VVEKGLEGFEVGEGAIAVLTFGVCSVDAEEAVSADSLVGLAIDAAGDQHLLLADQANYDAVHPYHHFKK
jgi:hypothetical protein